MRLDDPRVAGGLAAGLYGTVATGTLSAAAFIADGRLVLAAFGVLCGAIAAGLWRVPWIALGSWALHAAATLSLVLSGVFLHVYGEPTLRQGYVLAMLFCWIGLCLPRRSGPVYAGATGAVISVLVGGQRSWLEGIGLGMPLAVELSVVALIMAHLRALSLGALDDANGAHEETRAHGDDLRRLHAVLRHELAALSASSAVVSEDASSAVREAQGMQESLDEASQVVRRSSTVAQEAAAGSARVAEVVQTLADASADIRTMASDVVALAEQSRLLSLNASIEAVSAGDAGHGFAVVANEVKTLARQTTEAAARIEAHVQTINDAVASARGAMLSIAATIDDVAAQQQVVTTIVDNQHRSAATIVANGIRSDESNARIAASIRKLHDQLQP